MPAATLERYFPQLAAAGYAITSNIDPEYNCAAFAADETEEWWDPYNPDGVWPNDIDRDIEIRCFLELFERQGFTVCADSSLEAGYEKVVFYTDGGEFRHVARQLPDGRWKSKLGELEDIEHDTLDALICQNYGNPTHFMRRAT